MSDLSLEKSTIEHSGIYHGWVRHRRFSPRKNSFLYRVFMMYLDINEIDAVLAQSRFWSKSRWAPAQFRRKDFFGDPSLSLDTAIRNEILEKTQQHHTGPIRVLTNLRYFGYIINPITTYYCFNEQQQLQFIVAQVTSTPWDERISYVLSCDPNSERPRKLKQRDRVNKFTFNKGMHVSPFNPMDMQYHWRSNVPGERLLIDLRCSIEKQDVMDATLSLKREPISTHELNRVIWRYPWMTIKVVGAIYWQALKLWLKGSPFHNQPTQAANATVDNKTKP
ncbi:DUF1365 domain-containing protein [Gilvimarinus polysaccharolyticus]|uniref:DUF1365 domain-containing protein n=1 Tax=Gilvimarinus polysaccharolyticus TaxID=863921 RepID=UPI001E5E9DF1|nr:DUF1365 domain-containing protein [Gilvimarinus polysaccharolyticus]